MDLFREKIHSRGRWRKLDDWRSTSWSILWRKYLIVLIRSISWNCSTRQTFLLYWKKVKNAMALGCYVFWKIDRLETGQRRFFFNFPWIFLRLEIPGFTGISRITALKRPECYFNCLEDTEQEYFKSPIVWREYICRLIVENVQECNGNLEEVKWNLQDINQSSSLHRGAMLTSRNPLNYASSAIDFFKRNAASFSVRDILCDLPRKNLKKNWNQLALIIRIKSICKSK